MTEFNFDQTEDTKVYNIFSNKDVFAIHEISEKFVDYNHSTILYKDTVFYLHLYNSLYLALYKYNDENNHDIAKFEDLISKLKIVLDKSTPVTAASSIGVLATTGSGTVASPYIYTFTYYTKYLQESFSTIATKNSQSITYAVNEPAATTFFYTKTTGTASGLDIYTPFVGVLGKTVQTAYNAGIPIYSGITFTPAVTGDIVSSGAQTTTFYKRTGSVDSYVYKKITDNPPTSLPATNNLATLSKAKSLRTKTLVVAADDVTQTRLYTLTTDGSGSSDNVYSNDPDVIFKVKVAPTLYTPTLTGTPSESITKNWL